jgi:hypothetical protein
MKIENKSRDKTNDKVGAMNRTIKVIGLTILFFIIIFAGLFIFQNDTSGLFDIAVGTLVIAGTFSLCYTIASNVVGE